MTFRGGRSVNESANAQNLKLSCTLRKKKKNLRFWSSRSRYFISPQMREPF